MALATATISYNLADLVGAPHFKGTRVTATTNIPGNTIADTEGNLVRLGEGKGTINADGTGTIVVWKPGTGSNPASWQTTVHVDYPDRNKPSGRGLESFGPFTITADANLADLVAEMPVQPEYASAALNRIDGVDDHGSVSGAVSIDPDISTHWLDATGATVLTLGDGPSGEATRYVSILVISGADDVTIDGLEDVALTDGAFATFAWVRGAWMLAAAGGDTGPTDVTPPTDITDLGATGGEGELTITGTNPTDAESTARIKYRVWLTSGGASGSYLTATSFPIVVSGLAAGAYTVQAYSFSNGGQQTTPDSATATVTAPIPSYQEVVLGLSPLYYYPLDDTAGTTAPANLGSGSGAAAVTGSVTFGAAGIGDGATSADFGGGVITLPTAANLEGATSFTVGCIVDSDSAANELTYMASSAVGNGWFLGPKFAGIKTTWGLDLGNPTARVVAVLTWDGTNLKAYRDNTLVGTLSYSTSPFTNTPSGGSGIACIGKQSDNTWPMDGKIAGAFIVSGTAINAAKVAELVAGLA